MAIPVQADKKYLFYFDEGRNKFIDIELIKELSQVWGRSEFVIIGEKHFGTIENNVVHVYNIQNDNKERDLRFPCEIK